MPLEIISYRLEDGHPGSVQRFSISSKHQNTVSCTWCTENPVFLSPLLCYHLQNHFRVLIDTPFLKKGFKISTQFGSPILVESVHHLTAHGERTINSKNAYLNPQGSLAAQLAVSMLLNIKFIATLYCVLVATSTVVQCAVLKQRDGYQQPTEEVKDVHCLFDRDSSGIALCL
ncbi:hypothetical protein E1B28_004431 [Marasmius oreades]|nr:uncharacterized protein E1B28_004431 [Marasmius oreades]KAG7097040.1 hypothetical protein E1B28_004431 [Marasmius oreades]